MASEYKKRGGGYNTDKKDQDESQKHISQWTKEEWQTKEGSGNAKQADGTEKRYLPQKAWEGMTEEERKETDAKKLKESRAGHQFVQNTGAAKSARRKANKEMDKEFEGKKDGEEHDSTGDAHKLKEDRGENGHDDGEENTEAGNTSNTGQKRNRGNVDNEDKNEETSSKRKKPAPKSNKAKRTKSDKKNSKFHRSNGPATSGSLDRLPEKRQTVHWRSLQGWVEGTVVEVIHKETEVDGEAIKAKDCPRIVMRSTNGKIAVHKPGVVYFD